jgi:hypothetical protein
VHSVIAVTIACLPKLFQISEAWSYHRLSHGSLQPLFSCICLVISFVAAGS